MSVEFGYVQGENRRAQNMSFGGYGHKDANKIDYKIAYYIYNYLIGRTNLLPKEDIVYNVYSKDKDDVNDEYYERAVSMACGLILNNRFEITCEEPLGDACETYRVDIISCDDYKAKFASKSKVEEINLQTLPRFDERRVNMIQEYLRNIKELNKEGEKRI